MLVLDNALKTYLLRFKQRFGEPVPLRQISGAATNEQLVSAIQKCLDCDRDLLPEIFGFSNDPNKSY